MDIYQLYNDLFQFMKTNRCNVWLDTLIPLLEHKLVEKPHGDQQRWLDALESLPSLEVEDVDIATSVSATGQVTDSQQAALEASLRGLMPWRKGPFNLLGVHIDTEWRSDWKWDRVAPHISPLQHRLVLDVGCGSGYHCWRMLGAGAQRVVGIDPSYLFLMQFEAIKRYCGPTAPIHLLPIRMEDVAPDLETFDTVFSMGVLYHRRSPIDHLFELKGALRKGGELVLETLVIEGKAGEFLMPKDRYGMMRNVWFIPTTDTLKQWLERAGFIDIRLVDLNQTQLEEQRTTDWMRYQSLVDFLDPADPSKTCEGYPAPLRATLVATKA
ncbi:MAG: tRNA 5-methoxyuridine(34)/uridine 5-oxyacetic acid(34) synthase CmoB [Hahellaceae bacterium]|nr:tRNA 5-methoxyuridine(34)/uridine 5-oxyacetic acid(34) synthase CmoB [Hahellaceae bacterium]